MDLLSLLKTFSVSKAPRIRWQQKALQRLLQLQKVSSPLFPYAPWRQLANTSFKESLSKTVTKEHLLGFVDHRAQRSFLVFIDGCYAPHLSELKAIEERVDLYSLFDSHPFETFTNHYLEEKAEKEENPLALFNLIHARSALFCYLPPRTQHLPPIQCLNLITSAQPSWTSPLLFLFAGRQSCSHWIWRTLSFNPFTDLKEISITQPHIECIVEEEATVNLDLNLETSQAIWAIDRVFALLKKKSHLHLTSLSTGAGAHCQEFLARLEGVEAQADLFGLARLEGRCQAHTRVTVEHIAPECHSRQLFKGILFDQGKSSFNGKIWIHKEAQQSNAYQLNQHLLLSPHTIANSLPELQIFADDVKASHGSTVGEIDQDQLFYLTSRGLAKKEAEALLVDAFSQEVLQEVR